MAWGLTAPGDGSIVGKERMTPRLNLFDWWGKDSPQETPVIVKMENPNFSIVEIEGPDATFKPVEKSRLKNAKQVRWVLFLKANRAVGWVAWLATCLWALLVTIKKRLILRQGVVLASEKLGKGKLMLKILLVSLVTLLAILACETVAYLKGWHYFENPNLYIPHDVHSLFRLVYVTRLEFRAQHVAPFVQSLSTFCVVLFLIQSLDRVILSLGCLYIKMKKIKPTVNGDSSLIDDLEGAVFKYPMVLVQIPMCNEQEVYELSITAVCQLDWPKERLLIQVLDDSDDECIQQMIKAEVSKWSQHGINIIYHHRLMELLAFGESKHWKTREVGLNEQR